MIRWTCESTTPGRRDEPVAHDRIGVRPDRQVDPVADVRVAGSADPDDPAVLDPDVGLDDTDRRVDDDDPGDDDIELGRAGRPIVLDHPAAEVLGVAPQRLVAGVVGIALDAQPEVGVAEPDPVAASGRSAPDRPRARAGSLLDGARQSRADPTAEPDEIDLAGLAGSPADGVPGRDVETEARRGLALEGQPRVDPLERVVRGHADDPTRPVRDRQACAARARPRARSRPSPRRISPGFTCDRPADRRRAARPWPTARAGRRVRAGRARTTSRVPSPRRTSRRTSSSRARTPSMSSDSRDRRAAGGLDLGVAAAGPRRLEHRVADERDGLRVIERDPGRPMTPGELGGAEDQEPLLFPWCQAHRRHGIGAAGGVHGPPCAWPIGALRARLGATGMRGFDRVQLPGSASRGAVRPR